MGQRVDGVISEAKRARGVGAILSEVMRGGAVDALWQVGGGGRARGVAAGGSAISVGPGKRAPGVMRCKGGLVLVVGVAPRAMGEW